MGFKISRYVAQFYLSSWNRQFFSPINFIQKKIIIIIISFLELVVAMLANFLWTFLHSKMNLLYFSEVHWRKITKAYIVDIRLFRIFWLQLYIHRCQHQYQPHLNTMAMVIIYSRRILKTIFLIIHSQKLDNFPGYRNPDFLS